MKKKFRLVLDLKPHIGGQVKLKEPEKPVISFLLNCYYYFFQCVFIVKDGLCYRLVVNHRGRSDPFSPSPRLERGQGGEVKSPLLMPSPNKQMNAPLSRIRPRCLCLNIAEARSHFYPPEKKWLKKKMAEEKGKR